MGRALVLLCLIVLGTSLADAQTFWRRDTICINNQVIFSYIFTFNGERPNRWVWDMPNANPSTYTSTTDSANTAISFPAAGTYRVTVTMSYASRPDTSFFAEVIVLDPAPPSNQLGNDTSYCGQFTRVLDAGNAGSTYLWSTGSRAQRITVVDPGTYTVQVTNRCFSGSFSITLNSIPAPIVNLGPDGSICFEAPRTLDARNDGSTYLWNTGDTTQTITVDAGGTYSVEVTSPNGCVGRDEIVLRDSCPPDIWFPNAFTPNNDEYNQFFMPYVRGIAYIRMRIFDRWGEELFETEELNKGWDGTFRGKPCMPGVYMYMVTMLDNGGNRINRNGTFLLMR